jgi:hypothetical protein
MTYRLKEAKKLAQHLRSIESNHGPVDHIRRAVITLDEENERLHCELSTLYEVIFGDGGHHESRTRPEDIFGEAHVAIAKAYSEIRELKQKLHELNEVEAEFPDDKLEGA